MIWQNDTLMNKQFDTMILKMDTQFNTIIIFNRQAILHNIWLSDLTQR